ncbi:MULTISPECIES: primosomal protein N' [unclassified Sphingobium]|uniref:primosomal protein N' n=1 Tax=unclassified Sphingobium TaxID=2611147 RepID=UPI0022244484|nr:MULTISPECIES: primosomal protein N' [unclassified Sphingobium]MCW2383241.1 primosomal protein N' (replication factor Y) [Sphingobium sp. B2D3B]MCW2392319.1 primosomal protein N' (replication factor Y) [Sphingobium sp. B11D3A]MCW2399784.1 primosomal protein N' (replication factor Y) [Sphingobium sp. B2D3C]
MTRARIILLNAALGPLDYRVPHGMSVEPGQIVVAPLGPRPMIGVVWEADRFPDVAPVGDNRLRPITGVLDAPPLPASLRRLIEWTADYYLAPPAAVLRMALASMSALDGEKTVVEYRPTGAVPDRLTPQRAQALERIGERQGLVRELAAIGEVSDAVIRGLVKQGALEAVEVSTDQPYPDPDPDFVTVTLSADQQAAADRLTEHVRAHAFQTVLLDGVTGSGKTEVYFEALAETLRQGKQALVLLPEIALTEPFLDRFTARFGCEPVPWHSGLKQSDRRRAWRAISRGEAQVVVGARSALFLPYPKLGLIIVDEAHETSFKQEEGVRYHARDVAVMRGMFESCPIILASATPAIETRHQVALGRYEEIALPSRFGGAELPEIIGLDLTRDPPDRGRWLAPPLVKAMAETLERGEQSLLFLNRRGYAPLTLCRHCGHRFQCPHCTAWMVEHRLTRRLACHHCGHSIPTPDACPECHESDALVACGPGVERIADEVKLLFPQARTAIVTSDTLWSPARAAAFVRDVAGGAVDIIIGTQLVTKGYHFPELTLVGVVDADLGLDGGDLRAAERTYQQIMQVSGRAGRGEKPGRVFIQTRASETPVIRALLDGDGARFYAMETESRRIANAPPFGRFAAIIVSDADGALARETAQRIGKIAPHQDGLDVYGPAEAPLAVLRGRHRFRLLVHARRGVDLQAIVRKWLGQIDWKSTTRVSVDIDPYSFV